MAKRKRSEPEPPSSSFETEFAAAEAAADRLESGNLSLEECLRDYEQGAQALRRCFEALKSARRRIEILADGGRNQGEEGANPEWEEPASGSPLANAIERLDAEESARSPGGARFPTSEN